LWYDVAGKPLEPNAQEREFMQERIEVELQRSRALLMPENLLEYEQALRSYK
jgi:hypothetical protein